MKVELHFKFEFKKIKSLSRFLSFVAVNVKNSISFSPLKKVQRNARSYEDACSRVIDD
jgi:hypothetical protein